MPRKIQIKELLKLENKQTDNTGYGHLDDIYNSILKLDLLPIRDWGQVASLRLSSRGLSFDNLLVELKIIFHIYYF